MLGWHFTVKIPAVVDKGQPVATWEGGLLSDQWLQDAIQEKKAEIIEYHGGYPNLYLVAVEVLPAQVERSPELLNSAWCMVEVWDQS